MVRGAIADGRLKGPRMLPYDLNVLYQYVLSQKSKSLVLAFRDSEAFDSGVLSDLISLLRLDFFILAFLLPEAYNLFQFLG